MNKSEVFTAITKRNALRRESGLPLLNLREEIAKEQHQAQLRHYLEGFQKHADVYNRLRQEFIEQHVAETGQEFNMNTSGRMLVDHKVLPLYREFLAMRGYRFPGSLQPIVYGSDSDA